MYNISRFLLLKPQGLNTDSYNSRKKERDAQNAALLIYNASTNQAFDAFDGLPLPFLGDSGIKLQRR